MHIRERTKTRGPEIADGVLAKQSLAGDQQAFESLVKRYSGSLFNFICRFLGDYDQASDILQQVFLQLYISLPNLRTGEPLKAWLFQVARIWMNCVKNERFISLTWKLRQMRMMYRH